MHRFYIPPHAWHPDRLTLEATESHHALDVLRLGVGDRLTVFNGQGAEITGSAANDTAVFTWKAADITSQSWSYHYSYTVI